MFVYAGHRHEKPVPSSLTSTSYKDYLCSTMFVAPGCRAELYYSTHKSILHLIISPLAMCEFGKECKPGNNNIRVYTQFRAASYTHTPPLAWTNQHLQAPQSSILIHAVRAQLHLGIRCVFPFDLPRFSLLHSGSACKCLLSFPSQITDSIQDVPLTIHPGHYRMAQASSQVWADESLYIRRNSPACTSRQAVDTITSCFDLAVKHPYCCEFVPANMFSFYSECLHPPTAIETSPGRLSYCSTIPRIN